ncbi:hypothetical protein L6452_12521 [Arctium lappa]|uniref:Uncharacterized protein n=1 Tax=Arctium lappa TaxID=4217 RepID=A0ACB9DQS5_ARCLA|nr:hypothetical protein L6452_12521 [Arctium lappa]
MPIRILTTSWRLLKTRYILSSPKVVDISEGIDSVICSRFVSLFSRRNEKVVPHITDAIKDWIESIAAILVDGKVGPTDVCVIELGGIFGTTSL